MQPPVASPDEQRVVDVVREVALEVGGARAAGAVTPTASLERDVGLGSLERVELLTRLEEALGRELDERFLLIDTAREIAIAARDAPPTAAGAMVRRAAPQRESALRVEQAATLPEVLRLRADAEPARVHTYVQGEGDAEPLTYVALRDGAATIAAALRARGVRSGDAVAIMLPTGVDFLHAFMGVLWAGAVSVPLYPPARLDRMAEYLQRQARILANAEARILIAMAEAVPVAKMLRREVPTLETIVTADDLLGNAGRASDRGVAPPGAGGAPATGRAPLDGSATALIQYTSGSTGDPKGVVLTHANLLANIRAISEGVDLRASDVVVSWLPLYHDMGLIGSWLLAMVQGLPITLMSPLAFLARPERWLWAVHQRCATLSAAPNFAYELCVRKVRDEAIEGLDLSTWRCVLNGSEPVSAATIGRFTRRFAPHGFAPGALMPVYGLAENAVALTFPPPGRGPVIERIARESYTHEGLALPAVARDADAMTFVSVGRPLPAHEVRLVDDAGTESPERTVGRLLFRGPSATAGYQRNPEATAALMHPGGWLDSGDLAYRSGGELFITGRAKDLIIKGGRNLVPQEVEEVAGSVEGIRKGCVAAFGVADEATGTERLVLLAESRSATDATREALERAVVSAVADATGVPPDEVRIVPPGSVPKTPSGKLRRGAARALYESGQVGAARRVPLTLRLRLLAGRVGPALRSASGRARRVGYLVRLGVLWTLALALAAPPLALLVRLLPRGRGPRALERFGCRLALWISGIHVDVEGRGRLPRAGPVVLVSNHTSYADTPALIAALPIDFVLVAKREILQWPLVGAFIRRAGHPTVDREDTTASVVAAEEITRALRAGTAVLFFAEGGFAPATGLRPFRLGAFEAAIAAGVPVVPIALRGARRVLRGATFLPRRGRIAVWIGEQVGADGTDWKAALALRDRVSDAIAAHCGEPRLELAATPSSSRSSRESPPSATPASA